jgi:hypothetical protein
MTPDSPVSSKTVARSGRAPVLQRKYLRQRDEAFLQFWRCSNSNDFNKGRPTGANGGIAAGSVRKTGSNNPSRNERREIGAAHSDRWEAEKLSSATFAAMPAALAIAQEGESFHSVSVVKPRGSLA